MEIQRRRNKKTSFAFAFFFNRLGSDFPLFTLRSCLNWPPIIALMKPSILTGLSVSLVEDQRECQIGRGGRITPCNSFVAYHQQWQPQCSFSKPGPLDSTPLQFPKTIDHLVVIHLTTTKSYHITLLPGYGIGPEVISITKNVLNLARSIEGFEFKFNEIPIGGVVLDLTRVPLPEETLIAAKQYDVILGAIGGCKWDKNEKHSKLETGLLQLRDGLKVFANLRPPSVLPQVPDFQYQLPDSIIWSHVAV